MVSKVTACASEEATYVDLRLVNVGLTDEARCPVE
jgi:hypothetical protein